MPTNIDPETVPSPRQRIAVTLSTDMPAEVIRRFVEFLADTRVVSMQLVTDSDDAARSERHTA